MDEEIMPQPHHHHSGTAEWLWAQVERLDGNFTSELYARQVVAQDLLVTFCVMTLLYGGVVFVLSMVDRGEDEKSLLGTKADDVFNLAYLPILCTLSLVSTLRLGFAGVRGRWELSTASAYWFIVLYVAKNAMRTVTAMMLQDKKKGRELILVHHIISCVCYTHGLLHGKGIFFAVFAGLCEVTIIPVNFARVWSSFMCMAKRKRYAVNAIFGWVLWIAFRLVLFPVWLFIFCTDYVSEKDTLENVIPLPWAILFCVTIVILFGMSAIWFVSVHKGMVRAVRAFQQSSAAPLPEIPNLRMAKCNNELRKDQ